MKYYMYKGTKQIYPRHKRRDQCGYVVLLNIIGTIDGREVHTKIRVTPEHLKRDFIELDEATYRVLYGR